MLIQFQFQNFIYILKKEISDDGDLLLAPMTKVSTFFFNSDQGIRVSFTNISHISSRPEVFCKKGVLRNIAKFTGKHLYQSLFFNKVTGMRIATLLKKRIWHRCFPVNFAKFLRTPIFKEHIWWLLLLFGYYDPK